MAATTTKCVTFDDQKNVTWTYPAFEGGEEVNAPPPREEVVEFWPSNHPVASDMMIPNSSYRFIATRNKIISKTMSPANGPDTAKLQIENSANILRPTVVTTVVIKPPGLVKDLKSRKNELEAPVRSASKPSTDKIKEHSVHCDRVKLSARASSTVENQKGRAQQSPSRATGTKAPPPSSVPSPAIAQTPPMKYVGFVQQLSSTFGESHAEILSNYYLDDDDKKLLRLENPNKTTSPVSKGQKGDALKKGPAFVRRQVPANKEPVPLSHLFVGFFSIDEAEQPEKQNVWAVRSKLMAEAAGHNRPFEGSPSRINNNGGESESPAMMRRTVLESLVVDAKRMPTGPPPTPYLDYEENVVTNPPSSPTGNIITSLDIVNEVDDNKMLPKSRRRIAVDNAKVQPPVQKAWESPSPKDFRHWSNRRITESAKEKVLASKPILRDETNEFHRKLLYQPNGNGRQRIIPFDDFLRLRLLRMAKHLQYDREMKSSFEAAYFGNNFGGNYYDSPVDNNNAPAAPSNTVATGTPAVGLVINTAENSSINLKAPAPSANNLNIPSTTNSTSLNSNASSRPSSPIYRDRFKAAAEN